MSDVSNYLSIYDIMAVAFFLSAWIAHHYYSERHQGGLNAAMARRRREWIEQMSRREARMTDSITSQGLQNGAAFFASTSLIGIGGAIAALKASSDAVAISDTLPFGITMTPEEYDTKIIGLTGIFIYAFFNFVWATRLFNYGSVLLVCVPPPDQAGTNDMKIAVDRAARMNISAAKHFNHGLRSLFFVLAYLGWFVSPIIFVFLTVAIVIILWNRQFNSESFRAATFGDPSPRVGRLRRKQ